MDVKMVEIAVGILDKEPTDPIRPAREWAIDIINEYSHVPMSTQARAALLDNQVIFPLSSMTLEDIEEYIKGSRQNN